MRRGEKEREKEKEEERKKKGMMKKKQHELGLQQIELASSERKAAQDWLH